MVILKLADLIAETPRKLVFMDCDGVIFDTNKLKCDAFRHALEGYPMDDVEALVFYHRQTGGVSRYLKFERFFREMHQVPNPETSMRHALDRFASFCESGYARMSPRPEALRFAASLGGPERVYVVSGSDENELRRVFERQGLSTLFAAVHGSPVGKREHVGRILASREVAPHETLFVGDGSGDWDCARALGLPFVFLGEMSEWEDGPRVVCESSGPMAIAETWDALNRAVAANPG